MSINNAGGTETVDSIVDYTKFVRKLEVLDYFFLGTQLFLYGLIVGVFVNLIIASFGMPYLQVPSNPLAFWAICAVFPAILLGLLFYRNRFFVKRINQQRAGNFIYFTHWWHRAIPILTAFLVGYFVFVALSQDIKYVTISVVTFFILFGVYQIFDNPLTNDGEIYVLVDSMISNGNNFKKVQFFWKKLTPKIENQLNEGAFQVSNEDLNLHFSEKFFKTKYDFTADLVCIRDWLLGKQRSCYDSLAHIVPKSKIRQISPNKRVRKSNNDLANKFRDNWKLAFEIAGFIASIATIISVIIIFF